MRRQPPTRHAPDRVFFSVVAHATELMEDEIRPIKPIAAGSSALLIATSLLAVSPALATPPGPCTGTFSESGQLACAVPAGVTSVDVTVVGGNGGARLDTADAIGGLGAKIATTLQVTPGEVLLLVVGQNDQSGTYNGGGGAYSSISRVDYTDPANAVVVAGAGGGAGVEYGGNGFGGDSGTGGGAAGGDSARFGKPGGDASTPGGAGNAAGGSGGAAGLPGADAGTDPSADTGGGGGAGYGGGAGGVSVGGGGGGGSSVGVAGTTTSMSAAGGGGSGYAGGGGSSLIPEGATVSAGDGSPRIEFGGDPIDPVKSPQSIPAGVVKQRVKRKGTTVINPANSTTVEGRPLKVKSVKAIGLQGRGDVTCFRVVRKAQRLTRLVTTGQCKVKLRITYTAPGSETLYDFKQVARYARNGTLLR